jgi:hypothetical protein
MNISGQRVTLQMAWRGKSQAGLLSKIKKKHKCV